MTWVVRFSDEFEPEFELLAQEVQDELLAEMNVLGQLGPTWGRPHVDALQGSKHANMKELRFDADGGVWRVAFAFAPGAKALFWPRATRAVFPGSSSTAI